MAKKVFLSFIPMNRYIVPRVYTVPRITDFTATGSESYFPSGDEHVLVVDQTDRHVIIDVEIMSSWATVRGIYGNDIALSQDDDPAYISFPEFSDTHEVVSAGKTGKRTFTVTLRKK